VARCHVRMGLIASGMRTSIARVNRRSGQASAAGASAFARLTASVLNT
jgi:hypothetical protein